MNLQKYSDAFLAHTLLPFIPGSVTPNQVSWVRIACLPFIYYLLATGNNVAGFALFTVAALTDAVDGAMARTRNQITETGKVLDAVADRGLIIVVAVMLIPKYFGWPLLAAIAIFEILNSWSAYRARVRLGVNPGANWAGKIKMIIQCFAFGMMIIALFSNSTLWAFYAYPLLIVSLGFNVIQSALYPFMLVAA